jgi:hypothetical protein
MDLPLYSEWRVCLGGHFRRDSFMIISSVPVLSKLSCCHTAYPIFPVPQAQSTLDCEALRSHNC